MATKERAVLTALPAGLVAPPVAERAVGDASARLAMVTAFVTPRVEVGKADVPVSDLDAFAVWPAALEQWDLGVAVDGHPVPVVPHPDPPRPDPDLWARLFAKAVVRTRVFPDLSKLGLLTCPVSHVNQIVADLYSRFTATTLPTEGELVAVDDGYRDSRDIRDRTAQELVRSLPDRYRRVAVLSKMRKEERLRLEKEQGKRERDGILLGLAGRFYHRPEAERPTPPGVTLAKHLEALEAKPPDFDFHQICGIMGDYPLLLRALGLAVDLLIREDALGGTGSVAIWPGTEGPVHLVGSAASLPRTRYRHDDGLFVADDRDASPDPGIRLGMLQMEAHQLTTLDADSGAPQVIQALANATTRQKVILGEGHRLQPDAPSSLPALRTGGITVLRPGRHDVLAASLDRSSALEEAVTTNDDPPELWSDDVTRGWRVDVLDRDSTTAPGWLSLGERIGRYRFDGKELSIDGEEFEAYVKSASASTDTVDPLVLYTSESVVGWDGWSLAAPRPGRVITPTTIGAPKDDPPPRFPLSVAFTPVPRSLPVLRFGRTYQLRIRTADLAGNSHPLQGAPDGFESEPIVMTRWEPVLPPEVVPLHPFTEGESLLRVVLRSTRDVGTDAYVALDRVVNLPGHPGPSATRADWRYQATAARHLLAPKEAQLQAERHGGFDDAFGALDPAALWPLLEREERTFYDLPGAKLVDQAHPDGAPRRPKVRGGALKPHQYLTCPQRPVVAPYLPDHLAESVAIHGLPDRPADQIMEVRLRTGKNSWPDYRTAMLRVVEGPLGAKQDASGVVTVSLPKAEVLPIRVSSMFGEGSLAMLAVWERVVQADAKDQPLSMDLAKLRAAALKGQLWTLTPWTSMTLVHAVEMPLAEPTLQVLHSRADRLEGETFASLVGVVKVHAKSTGRVDIDASWTEPRDDIGRPPTLERSAWAAGAAHVGHFDVRTDEEKAQIGRIETVSTSMKQKPKRHAVRHELGDTKHRMVTYRTTATTRFREYFPPAITGDPSLITTASDALVDVPSSRRPEPPEVAYAVPIFGWDEARYARSRLAGKIRPPAFRRTRRGGGLRVYLRRPWWSSGEGERLAVVLPNQPLPAADVDLGRVIAGQGVTAADVKSVTGTLNQVLGQAGVKGATESKLARIFKNTDVAEGPLVHRRLLSTLHDSMAAAGVDVGRPTLERAWGQVVAQLGPGTSIDIAASSLNESERSAFVTRWGRDPTAVAGNPTLSPRISDFVDRDGHANGLALAQPAGERVAVATYEPQFDAERDLWFVDLHVAEHDHFMPFIRLALARYQQHSIDPCHLSEVRVGDFMQLLPTREVTVRDFADATLHVTVRGRAGHGAIAAFRPGTNDAASRVSRTLHVRAWVEQHRSSSPTDLDWEPAADALVSLPLDRLDPAWQARWFAQVPLPKPAKGMAYRLAVEELQVHQTDADNVGRDPHRFGSVGGPIDRGGMPVGLRLLWADRIDLKVADGRLAPDAPDQR